MMIEVMTQFGTFSCKLVIDDIPPVGFSELDEDEVYVWLEGENKVHDWASTTPRAVQKTTNLHSATLVDQLKKEFIDIVDKHLINMPRNIFLLGRHLNPGG